MILLSPIHKKIRSELHRRIHLVSREKNAISTITSPQNTTTTKIHPQRIYTKSVWLQLRSMETNGPIMVGMELNDDQSVRVGLKSMYHSMDETSRFRPYPGLKSISSEYKGGIKALRTATISWVCWSLDDLNRYKPFLLSHGKRVVIEWGWSTDLTGRDIQTITPDEIESGVIHSNIQKKIIQNSGNYDAMIGVITNFNWTLRDDGGFDCTTEIVSRGIDMFKKNINPDNSSGTIPNVPSQDTSQFPVSTGGGLTFNRFMEGIKSAMVLARNSSVKLLPGYYNMVRGTFGPYISWGWMEDNIISRFLAAVSEETSIVNHVKVPKFYTQFRSIESVLDDDAQEIKYLPTKISNHEYLYTTDANIFILPGQFPTQVMLPNSELHELGSDINLNEKYYPPFADPNDPSRGILRNILLSWSVIEESFESATTLESGLKTLFGKLNDEAGGIWNFEIVSDESGNLSVIDTNVVHKSPKDLLSSKSTFSDGTTTGDLFEFPVWTKNTIVTQISMDAKLPSSMAISAMYGVNNNSEISTVGDTDDKKSAKLAQAESTVNNSSPTIHPGWQVQQFGSADPTDPSRPLSLQEGILLNIQPENSSTENGTNSESSEHILSCNWSKVFDTFFGSSVKNKISDLTPTEMEKIVKSITITQLKNINTIQNVVLYNIDGKMDLEVHDTMKYMITDNPGTSITNKFPILMPIDLTISINGIGGIFPGNCFTIDTLPEYYQTHSIFQVMSVNHDVDDSGWKVEIVGRMRIDISESAQKEWLSTDVFTGLSVLRDKLSEDEQINLLKQRGFYLLDNKNLNERLISFFSKINE